MAFIPVSHQGDKITHPPPKMVFKSGFVASGREEGVLSTTSER